MLQFFKKLLFRRISPDAVKNDEAVIADGSNLIVSDEELEKLLEPSDVLRYPPSLKGLPAIPGEYFLKTHQSDLVTEIKKEIALRDSEFEELIQPMLNKFAEFVQFFPASENHHHRAPGGLLRHSLEVCLYSIRRAKNIEFDGMEDPEKKSRRSLVWRLAVATGGLLHDVGKPITDFEVWDKSGRFHWIPGSKSVDVWAKEINVSRFYLVWKSPRHQQHHYTTGVMLRDIMPEQLHNALLLEGNEIYNEMVRALSVAENPEEEDKILTSKNKILKIIRDADSLSVRQDMAKYGGDAVRASQSGVPAVQRIVDAMRYLLKKEKWKANRPGNPVWLTTQGVFVVWRSATEDIIRIVKRSGAMIPQSEDSLADLMLSYRICVPNNTETEDSAYWYISPHCLNRNFSGLENARPNTVLGCLRLAGPEVLFTESVEPLPVSCFIREGSKWRDFPANKTASTAVLVNPVNCDTENIKNAEATDNAQSQQQQQASHEHEDTDHKNQEEQNNEMRAINILHDTGILNSSLYEKIIKRKEENHIPVSEENYDEPKQRDDDVAENTEQLSSDEPSEKISLTTILSAAPHNSLNTKFNPFDYIKPAENTEQPSSDEPSEKISLTTILTTVPNKSLNTKLHPGDDRQPPEDTDISVPDDSLQQNQDSTDHPPPGEIFLSGSLQAQELLKKYISERKFKFESGRAALIPDKAEAETSFKILNEAGWIWQPFMKKPSVSAKSECFLLKKELDYDVDRLSAGMYGKLCSFFDLNDVNISTEKIAKIISENAKPVTAWNGDAVFQLTAGTKKIVASELGITVFQLHQLIHDRFDVWSENSFVNSADYILATETYFFPEKKEAI